MNVRYGASPMGVKPTSSHFSAGMVRSISRRRAQMSFISASTSAPGRDRRGAIWPSLKAAMPSSPPSVAAGSGLSPASISSRPTMWLT